MIKGLDAVLISSENPKVLADFYKDKVGLEFEDEFEYGEKGEAGFMFKVGSTGLTILPHDQVKGKNPSGARIMLNIEVDDIEKEVKRLKDAGIKCVAEIYHVEGYGYIATFEDPDGNYFQLVQVRG
ncbi:MAG: VOC family protein [Candidatus Daviesbacteria bacterium]|nr:VOC family protein [Candidatus Daviesbacteria bacterium]